jgi:curli biogenesis system outer membrane secretion channel CsgG
MRYTVLIICVFREQNLSRSNRADPANACKIGKLLSVDAIVVGAVTQFGFESKTVGASGVVSARSYAPYGRFAGALGGFSHHSSKVKVDINFRH